MKIKTNRKIDIKEILFGQAPPPAGSHCVEYWFVWPIPADSQEDKMLLKSTFSTKKEAQDYFRELFEGCLATDHSLVIREVSKDEFVVGEVSKDEFVVGEMGMDSFRSRTGEGRPTAGRPKRSPSMGGPQSYAIPLELNNVLALSLNLEPSDFPSIVAQPQKLHILPPENGKHWVVSVTGITYDDCLIEYKNRFGGNKDGFIEALGQMRRLHLMMPIDVQNV